MLEHCANLRVGRLLCLGDIVGYGAEPAACIERVRESAASVVAGNHDWAAAGKASTHNFNPAARLAIQWTAEQLTEGDRFYLCGLPIILEEQDALLVHSSPVEPDQWPYLFSTADGRVAMAATSEDLTFVGHSHYAFACSQSDATRVTGEGDVTLTSSDRYLVNVGSVGQPRDSDPRAAVCIWEPGAGTVSLQRVPYDVASAQAKIRAARLPAICADRLEYGN